MVKKKVRDPFRQELAQCTAKICAYLAVDKLIEARQWADKLQAALKRKELIR
jgi:hypothetical protein